MTSQQPAAARNRALVVLDVVAGIVLLAFEIVLGLVVIGTATAFAGAEAPNQVLLGTAVLLIIVVTVLAAALGIGFFVVALIRKRLAFVWPLGAVVLTVIVFYAGTALATAALA